MKLEINDDCGSRVIAVLKLDGNPAVINDDFAEWSGEYHKNGKWSYTEGGVALKNGIVIINGRSTHHRSNNNKRAIIVKDNVVVETIYIGKLSELPEKPKYTCKSIPETVFDAVIESCLNNANKPGFKAELLAKWAKMEKFA